MASTGIRTEKSSRKEYISLGGFQNVPDNLVGWRMDQILQMALQKAFEKYVQPLWAMSLGFLDKRGLVVGKELRSLERYYASS